MATAVRGFDKARETDSSPRPIVTRITNKFQITIPPEVRSLFDLREGDLFEWSFDPATSRLVISPKRAQLITPQLKDKVNAERRSNDSVPA